MASHPRPATVLTLEDFLLGESIAESLLDVRSFKRGVVHIIQPPIRRLAYHRCSIVMTDHVKGEVLISRTLQTPLPDSRVHDAKTDGIRQGNRLLCS
jgi:hypothetical protein